MSKSINQYDVIVVGGGHNGLVAAWYLQNSGQRVLVLERRDIVGGPSAQLEFFPGYHGAYTNSPGSLEPKVVHDLSLEKFGLEFVRPDPSVIQPFDDGRAFVGWRDPRRMHDGLAEFSQHDADAFPEFVGYLERFAQTLNLSLFEPPPSFAELASRIVSWQDEEAYAKIMLGSIKALLEEFFETDQVRSTQAILGQMSGVAGPSVPGTPLFLLMRPFARRSSQVISAHNPYAQPMRGSTGLPVGGMGVIPAAMRKSLESIGGEVRTESTVQRILVENGGAVGVVLGNGEEIRAGLVLSNLNPKTTFLHLLDPADLDSSFRERVEKLVMKGNQFKLALALDGLPRWAAARTEEEVQQFASCQFRIAPSVEYMDRSFDAWKYGRWPEHPVMWGLTPSVTDPTLAPPGKHVMSINLYHAPYELAEGDWSTERDRFGRHCIEVLSRYVTNLKEIITDVRCWSPKDIEAELDLVEANITHGDMMPGRMFSFRPLPGWSDYRTPVRGLYLCGSGTWPSGYVTGLPGHNASHQAIKDLKAGLERTHAAVLTARA